MLSFVLLFVTGETGCHHVVGSDFVIVVLVGVVKSGKLYQR